MPSQISFCFFKLCCVILNSVISLQILLCCSKFCHALINSALTQYRFSKTELRLSRTEFKTEFGGDDPSYDTSTLSGFKSRCAMPFSCR